MNCDLLTVGAVWPWLPRLTVSYSLWQRVARNKNIALWFRISNETSHKYVAGRRADVTSDTSESIEYYVEESVSLVYYRLNAFVVEMYISVLRFI
jgi:hypothetical protein